MRDDERHERSRKVNTPKLIGQSVKGPSRSSWNGTRCALQSEEISSKGTRVSCVYYL